MNERGKRDPEADKWRRSGTVYREPDELRVAKGIPQRKIMDLLMEAANSAISRRRKIQINRELDDAFRDTRKELDEGQEEKTELIDRGLVLLDTLYVQTLQERPDVLPALFPVFAMMCGDPQKHIYADVDWPLVPQNPTRK